MPQQLIYTSAQRGVVAGRSGYCTVARSASMREALMLQLEKLSYYQHLSLSGGQERRISTCRFLEIRGTRYHVLSRLQDAGLDFTGRTNFLAHHLVFTPEEIRQQAAPPVILAQWSGWLKTWNKEPESLENETWGNLPELAAVVSVPAQTWQNLSGEAANGYGLLDLRTGTSFRVDNATEEQILALFAESLELLELRDPRRDHRATAWQYTFTTSMQEQDNPADFKWRCLHADNPASARFAGPDCRDLTDVKVIRATNEEKSFAQLGKQPPHIVAQPQDVRLKEGEAALLSVRAEGVPTPDYQWYSVDKAGSGQIIPNATGSELALPNPPFGVSRYVVQVRNSVGTVTSDVAKVECEKQLKLAPASPSQATTTHRAGTLAYDPDYEAKRDNQRHRYEQEALEQENKNRRIWNKFTMAFGLVVLVILGLIGYLILPKDKAARNAHSLETNPTPKTSSAPVTASNSNSVLNNSEPASTNNMVDSDQSGAKPSIPRTEPSEVNVLPPDWTEITIGESGLHKAWPINPPYEFDIISAYGEFQTNHDHLFFLGRIYSGKGFAAKVSKIATNAPSGLNGIMIRDSSKTEAPFLFIGATAQKVHLYRRLGKNGYASTNVDLSKVGEGNVFVFKFEEREGRCIPSYTLDSVNWTSFEHFDFPVGTNSLVGFAQAYGLSDAPAKARFVYLPKITK